MKKQTLLILTSIIGFILTVTGVVLTFLLNQVYYLALLVIGIIMNITSLALSSRLPQAKIEPEEIMEDLKTIKAPNETLQQDKPIEIPEKVDQAIDLDKYTIELDIDTKTSEALLRLTEKMTHNNLLAYNTSYEEENKSTSDIFKEAFKPIPVIGLVKNRFNNYNILAGINHDDVEIIGTIKEENLELVQAIHPKTQNIRAIITGGKFKTPENTEHTQAHRVQVTFYV